MSNFNQLSGAIRFALLAGAASTFAAVPAFAQDSEEDAATLETIEVTGSRLKRAEIEGAVPVVVIDRAQIDASGDVTVADVLRDSTFAVRFVRPVAGHHRPAWSGFGSYPRADRRPPRPDQPDGCLLGFRPQRHPAGCR